MFVLFYDYVEDIATRREPIRPRHLDFAREFHADGKLRLAGALIDPIDSALLDFTDRASAEDFALRDPYVLEGLVTKHRVREWNVVIGE